MTLTLAAVSGRKHGAKSGAAALLAEEFVKRASHYIPTELGTFSTETELISSAQREPSRRPARPAATIILFDSKGTQLTSVQFSALIGRLRDRGTQRLLFAIGPADGWTDQTRSLASHCLSLGLMTLSHELARAVAAEQIYRALTILAGHPYHSGHEN